MGHKTMLGKTRTKLEFRNLQRMKQLGRRKQRRNHPMGSGFFPLKRSSVKPKKPSWSVLPKFLFCSTRSHLSKQQQVEFSSTPCDLPLLESFFPSAQMASHVFGTSVIFSSACGRVDSLLPGSRGHFLQV